MVPSLSLMWEKVIPKVSSDLSGLPSLRSPIMIQSMKFTGFKQVRLVTSVYPLLVMAAWCGGIRQTIAGYLQNHTRSLIISQTPTVKWLKKSLVELLWSILLKQVHLITWSEVNKVTSSWQTRESKPISPDVLVMSLVSIMDQFTQSGVIPLTPRTSCLLVTGLLKSGTKTWSLQSCRLDIIPLTWLLVAGLHKDVVFSTWPV